MDRKRLAKYFSQKPPIPFYIAGGVLLAAGVLIVLIQGGVYNALSYYFGVPAAVAGLLILCVTRGFVIRDAEADKQLDLLAARVDSELPDALKLTAKEQELERLTADATKARSVVQPFHNHKVDFTPPQIIEKVPLFGTDKWVERQNQYIAKQFTEIVRKIESLYRNDAARQVEAAQRNALADYGELYQLKRENKSLSDTNESLEAELNTLLDQLSTPSVRNLIFAVADALIGGQPVPISSGGGGSTSALPWDGRRPDEEEEAYRRRCLLHASQIVKAIRSGYRRR